MAAEKVFATSELLEAILLDVQIDDILVNAQRVSKTWQMTIKSSPQLQQALFSRPVPSLDTIKVSFPPPHQQPSHSRRTTSNERKKPEATGEPFLGQPALKNPMCAHFEKLAPVRRNRVTVAFRRPEARWRRMLLSQPPLEISRGEFHIRRLGDLANHAYDVFRCSDWSRWLADWEHGDTGGRYTAREVLSILS